MIMRVILLVFLTWIMGLTRPLFTVLGNEISGRDIILIAGGLFLLAKSTLEIHDKLEGKEGRAFRACAILLCRSAGSDHTPRYGVFPGFGHHGHRDG